MEKVNTKILFYTAVVIGVSFLLFKVILPYYKGILLFLMKITFPFVMAIIISYLLYPVLHLFIYRLNMNRTSAISIIFIAFFSLASLSVYQSVAILFNELEEIVIQLPEFIANYEQMVHQLHTTTQFLPVAVGEQIESLITNVELFVQTYVEKITYQLIHLVDDIIIVLLIPVLVFYMLKDFPTLRANLYEIVPERHEESTRRILTAIHEAFGTYLRGQVVLSTFIFGLTYFLFYLIKMKYNFILALFMGMMNVIPYFGPIIGTIPAAAVAFTISPDKVVFVILISIIVQIIESALLSPYIMGKTAKLHPMMIIFILLVSAELGGIVLMVIAIPLVMIIKAIYIHLKTESTLMR